MYEAVTQIIRDYVGEGETLTPQTNLITDLGLSSFDVISLIGDMEDAFEIEIPTEDIEEMETVQSVVNYIEKRKNEA